MTMGPREHEAAKQHAQNSVITDASRDLAKHALACNNPDHCDRCAAWRSKPWVKPLRVQDDRDALNGVLAGAQHPAPPPHRL